MREETFASAVDVRYTTARVWVQIFTKKVGTDGLKNLRYDLGSISRIGKIAPRYRAVKQRNSEGTSQAHCHSILGIEAADVTAICMPSYAQRHHSIQRGLPWCSFRQPCNARLALHAFDRPAPLFVKQRLPD